jgi:hypothetical protein
MESIPLPHAVIPTDFSEATSLKGMSKWQEIPPSSQNSQIFRNFGQPT